MEETMAASYWCHMCSQMVIPIMEVEIKCPFCQSGFVEEMGSSNSSHSRDIQDPESDFGTDRALSLWAPILLGMMSSPRRRRRLRRIDSGDDDDDGESSNGDHPRRHGAETDLDQELESFLRRRRRSPASILQLLQGVRAGLASEYENSETANDRDRERDRVVLINPLDQTVIGQGSNDLNQSQNHTSFGSLGDYFIGPGLDLLLQHLAENDPSRYGTPPAQKQAVEALPTVKITENLQCSVCLDDVEIAAEVKVMPCKHKFHSQCIIPWLELHSSCPVCRYQLPADETKVDLERSRSRNSDESNDNNTNGGDEEGEGEGRSESRRRFSFSWPFSGLFSSSSSSQSGGNDSSSGFGSRSTSGS